MQLCYCIYTVDALDYSDSLPKTGKVTKIRLKEGINHPIIWGYPHLQRHHCGSIPVSIFVLQGPREACLCLSLEFSLNRCLQKVKPGQCHCALHQSIVPWLRLQGWWWEQSCCFSSAFSHPSECPWVLADTKATVKCEIKGHSCMVIKNPCSKEMAEEGFCLFWDRK